MISLFTGMLEALTLALSLSPDLLALASSPGARPVALAVAVLGGASLLAGESVVLFLNQVPRTRFLLSLLVNGLLFAVTLWVWAASIWWIGTWGMRVPVSLDTTVNLVLLGSAPFAFGFLVLAPYMGPGIARLLWVWSLLITVRAVAWAFDGGVLAAGAAVGAGWILVLLMGRTVGRPFVHLRNRIWDRVTGPRPRRHARDILEVAMEAEGPTLLGRLRLRIGPQPGIPQPREPRVGGGRGGGEPKERPAKEPASSEGPEGGPPRGSSAP